MRLVASSGFKATYGRSATPPAWESSLLIVTWDEPGGFYDHRKSARGPARRHRARRRDNQYGFTFQPVWPPRSGIVVIAAHPEKPIDHRDLRSCFHSGNTGGPLGLNPMTGGDARPIVWIPWSHFAAARNDAPRSCLCQPIPEALTAFRRAIKGCRSDSCEPSGRRRNKGNLPAVLHSAMGQDLAISPDRRPAIVARVASIKTRD